MPERLIKERRGGRGRRVGGGKEKCIEGKKREKKKSSLEVEVVLQSLLTPLLREEEGGWGLWPKTLESDPH